MTIFNSRNFLYRAISQAERLESGDAGIEEVQLSRNKNYLIADKDNGGNILDFGISCPHYRWPEKLESMEPKVYLEGKISGISNYDCLAILNSLITLSAKESDKINSVRILDRDTKTAAVLKDNGPVKGREIIIASHKEPFSSIFSNTHRYAKDSGLDSNEYSLKPSMNGGFGEGVCLTATAEDAISILNEFAKNRKRAEMNELVIGSGPLPVDFEDAKRFVFSTPLKKISYADVNCTTNKGVMTDCDIDAGALHVADDRLKLKVRDSKKLKDMAGKFLLAH